MTTAEHAAAPLLPELPVRQPNEPGQFGFADPDRVRAMLAARRPTSRARHRRHHTRLRSLRSRSRGSLHGGVLADQRQCLMKLARLRPR